MLRKGNAALTKQVVHVDHAEQAALFVGDGQYRDRFAFHEFKKRGDRIALGPAAGRRRHDGADRGLGIERPTADGPLTSPSVRMPLILCSLSSRSTAPSLP